MVPLVRVRSSSCLILACVVVLTIAAVVTLADDGTADTGPMVESPSGPGPMQVGHYETSFRGSTKSYDTLLRIYYPATIQGMDAPPDVSDAPYMTVVWFPFFGGRYDAMDPQCEQLASWGAVVVAYGVNWEDMQHSGDPDDVNDLLDMLEDLNATDGHTLFGMVDEGAYGMCGYSSGGGISLITGAQVPRIKAIQSWAAAIYNAAVDGIAPMFNGRPLLLQVGKADDMYIEGSERAYKKVGAPCVLVEIIDAGHGGPFQDHMYVAFYLYHLKGDDDYRTFLYGDGAVDLVADGVADVYFKLDDDHFFPPELHTTVSHRTVPMDEPVSLEATFRGYQRGNGSDAVHGWDVDGDGSVDLLPSGGPNTTHAFTHPATHQVQYHYGLGSFTALGEVHLVEVTNVAPVAVAGPDVEVVHDGSVELDGGASWDSPSDGHRLRFRWEFSDDFITDITPIPSVDRSFTVVGVVTGTLTVYDPHGGESTDTLNVTVVNVPPSVAVADGMTAVEDDPVSFEAIGNDTPSHVADLVYRWDFGDGAASPWGPSSGPDHTYIRSGNYTATVTVKDPEGGSAMASVEVTVLNLAPDGTIHLPENGSRHDKGEPVDFAADGSDTPSDRVHLLFRWDFGDGTSTDWLGRRDTNLSHTYLGSGTFSVVLTVLDTDGATRTVIHTITVVNTLPLATIVRPWPSAEVKEDTRVTFLGTGTDTPDDVDGLVFQWVIDGVTYAGDRAEHTFEEAGTYGAVFSVTDPEGALAVTTVTVTVENVPPEVTLSANASSIRTGGTVRFSVDIYDTGSDMGTHVVSWDFGDGGTGGGVEVVHTFATKGTYQVSVTVEDDDGATAIASVAVTVTNPPEGPVDPPAGNGGGGDDGGYPINLWTGLIILLVVLGIFGVLLLHVHHSTEGGLFGRRRDDG